MEIQMVRLVSGEEIIGTCKLLENGDIEVINPMLVDTAYNQNGEGYVVLNKYMPFVSEERVVFKSMHVLNSHTVHHEVQKFYTLSRYFSKELEITRFQEMKNVNERMIEIIEKKYDEHTNDVYGGSVHPGNETKH